VQKNGVVREYGNGAGGRSVPYCASLPRGGGHSYEPH